MQQAGERRPTTSGRARRADGEDGVTLIELVLALTIFALLMTGIAQTVGSGMQATRNNRNRSVAANLASQDMDKIRSTDITLVESLPDTETVTVPSPDGVEYTIDREFEWVPKGATQGPCTSSGGTPQVLRVHVEVTWPVMNGVAPARADTVLSPPVGSFDPTRGHIAVKVLDRNAMPAENVPVNITGPTPKTETTNSDGCAFFSFLTPGNYTVRLANPGWVDRQGVANPTQAKTVVSGQIASVQFDYDQAAALGVVMTPDAGGTVPSDMVVSLGNTNFVPNSQKSFNAGGATPTVSNLFPALDGYEIWAGKCADSDPEGVLIGVDGSGNPVNLGKYWPTGVRGPIVTVEPGVTTPNVVVPLRTVRVTVTRAGVPQANRTVIATHAADNLCTSETHVLGVTDAAGNVVAALPWGTWRMTVQSASPSGAWPNLVADPAVPGPTPASVVIL
jgi:prepilin-type N-terminal cleavage/methylation domain-containing protein